LDVLMECTMRGLTFLGMSSVDGVSGDLDLGVLGVLRY